MFNKADNVMIIVDNGYSAATGGQDLLSSKAEIGTRSTNNTIESAVRGIGVNWVRTLTRTYDVAGMRDTLREALTTKVTGPKVIIAQSECMLNKQRREKPLKRAAVKRGERVVRERFGVDPDTCTGDHSCIRLSGCPSLTIAPNPDPLRREPVTKVIDSCVGCGLCGEVSHAAVLCPSFYRASIIDNPNGWDRFKARHARCSDLVSAAADGSPRGGAGMNKPLAEITGATRVRPITIAIQAMGGEGGGVLADWIVDMAERGGYLAQATSVPGLAQRTGQTLYYIELFAKAAARDQEPVLALMPVPGDVDVVLASELMEAARAIARGLVTPDRTTLIASTHRVYTMNERLAMTDGRVDADALLKACQEAAGKLHAFDMASIAEATGSLVSAVLYGALAGSGALPFPRPAFEATIRRGGVGVEASLLAFGAGFEAASSGSVETEQKTDKLPVAPAVQALIAPIDQFLSPLSRPLVTAGVARLIDYQNTDYARLYVERLQPVMQIELPRKGEPDELLAETARQLALAMAYEDTIRVAQLKIRSSRFQRVRDEVGVKDNQLLEIVEFMHPRVQEIADTLPAPLGRFLMRTTWLRRFVEIFTRKGRVVKTTSIRGFLLLYAVAGLKPLRPHSLRYGEEQRQLSHWLANVVGAARGDYRLAVEIAHCRGLVKGYGDTHERGRANYEAIIATLPSLRGKADAAATIANLRKAAIADDTGIKLRQAVGALRAA